MKSDNENKDLASSLAQARARLNVIARMAQLNMQCKPSEEDFNDVLRSILAACGQPETLVPQEEVMPRVRPVAGA